MLIDLRESFLRAVLSGPCVMLGLLSAQAAAQGGVPAPHARTNSEGPTIADFHGAPLKSGAQTIKGTVGPITTGTRWEFQYELPHKSLAVFVKCGADTRCDRAAFVRTLGPLDVATAKRLNEQLFVINQLYSGNAEEMVVIKYATGEFALIQAFTVRDGWSAESFHDRFRFFVKGIEEVTKDQ